MVETISERVDKVEASFKDIKRIIEAHAETHKTYFNKKLDECADYCSRIESLENQVNVLMKIVSSMSQPAAKPDTQTEPENKEVKLYKMREVAPRVSSVTGIPCNTLELMRCFYKLGYVKIRMKSNDDKATIIYYCLKKGEDEGIVVKYGAANQFQVTDKGINILVKYVKDALKI